MPALPPLGSRATSGADAGRTIRLKRFDMGRVKDNSVIIFIGKRNTGKCLGRDTPVLMWDGTVKKVQDVVPGDRVMGDDSTPRNVLATTTGSEELFRVTPTRGDPYIVNKSHILSLKVAKVSRRRPWAKGDVVDVPVADYLKLPKQTLVGYRVPAQFEPKAAPTCDPYMLGHWLGGGTSCRPEFTTADDVVAECDRSAKSRTDSHACSTDCNAFSTFLDYAGLLNDKHVPLIYKTGSRAVQLQVLAGFLDACGWYDANNDSFELTLGNERLLDDMIFIARALGFAAFKTAVHKTCTDATNGHVTATLYSTHIHGANLHVIPCRVPRKQPPVRRTQRTDPLVTDIDVQPIGVGEYFGFSVDGNHRFLLGDFTVTHNSFLIRDLLWYKRSFPMGTVISTTESANSFYSKIVPSLFIHEAYNTNILANVFKRQAILKKRAKEEEAATGMPSRLDLRNFVVMDDCMYDNKFTTDPNIRKMFFNGRHSDLLYLLSLQYVMGIPPTLRGQVDYCFILRENNVQARKRLFEQYCGMFPNFMVFCDVMDQCTNDFELLVVDQTSRSNRLEDVVFWYKAEAHPDFRIGAPEYWIRSAELDRQREEAEAAGLSEAVDAVSASRTRPLTTVVKY